MIPERYAPATYALFRIVFGFIFLIFGLQKFGLLQGQAAQLASLQGAAGVIETSIPPHKISPNRLWKLVKGN